MTNQNSLPTSIENFPDAQENNANLNQTTGAIPIHEQDSHTTKLRNRNLLIGVVSFFTIVCITIFAKQVFLTTDAPTDSENQEAMLKNNPNDDETSTDSSVGIKLEEASPDGNDSEMTVLQVSETNLNIDTTTWISFNDMRGYSFKYPSDWFVLSTDNYAYNIQNWNPETSDKRPGPLSGDMSKWDINFSLQNFTTEAELLQKYSENIRVDLVEKSKTAGGLDIYFIQGTDSFFGNEDTRVPIISAHIVSSNKYFNWFAIYSGNEVDADILKATAQSIK